MNKTTIRAGLALATFILIGCTATGPGPTNPPASIAPTPTPQPSPVVTDPPTSEVRTAAQAAALVFASDPRWAEMMPLRSDLIGASSWYEAFVEPEGFGVVITAGSGDCMAGCINQRHWTYHVDPDGTVALVKEEGDEIELTTPIPSGDSAQVRVSLAAGPVCPVVQNPPDPNCADRPVANATVTLYAADGTEVATATTQADGTVVFEVDPGAYYVVAQPVQGMMGTPDPQAFSVIGGSQAFLTMGYDTGIR